MPTSAGDPKPITTSTTGVQQFAWRPDGGAIAYVAADTAPNQSAIDAGDDAFEVGDDDIFTSAAPTPSHIWLVPAQGGESKRLTAGSWSIPSGPPIPFLSWSPDGRSIAFMRQATPHEGDSDGSTIQVIDVATGAVHGITGRATSEGYPVYSPDGSHIAYWYPRDGDPNNVNEISVVSAHGGTPVPATRQIDRALYRGLWMPDSRSLIVAGNDRTRVALWRQPVDGPARVLDLGDVSPTWSFYWVVMSVGPTGALAFTGSTPHSPTELYYMASPTAALKRLTDFNHDVSQMTLGRAEALNWDGPDGFAEDGVVVYPPDFNPSKRYPLVLFIHGGPQGSSAETWDPFAQVFASHGYVVFSPNYRGSDSFGNAYQRAIVHDAGDGPGRDIMSGIAALERRGFIDTARVAVTGWSYGGTMTTWLIGHYHNWAAAVAGAAATDFEDQYNFSDLNMTQANAFGGSPWRGDRATEYKSQSPITYATQIRTPTLILSDLQDSHVPPTQSFKLYHALRDNGVPVSFVLYPVPGHFPADPVHSRDVLRRWVGWLDRYLGGAPAGPQPSAASR